jgi:S-adenosylmethionine:tRNA ribosyltransferase-isomerase
MFLSDYDFELPDELIARYPTPARRDSRLLIVGPELDDRQFADLVDFLDADDLLVFNDTRVIRARLRGTKDTGGKVELLVERVLTDNECLAQVRASKSPKPGSSIALPAGAQATVLGKEDRMFRLELTEQWMSYLESYGEVPLPPYLDRDEESADLERYQTVYAAQPGAVAAPTAGLHFDQQLLDETQAMGVRHATVTLHVGAGTFLPLREEQIDQNRLHSERLIVGADTASAVRETREAGGRVVAVGTTSVRALEAASASDGIAAFDGETDLFIRPGYAFRSVDAILTNFHLPRSSLLMLVSAFAGRDRMIAAYQHAVKERYRFFSYGDAMLIGPAR